MEFFTQKPLTEGIMIYTISGVPPTDSMLDQFTRSIIQSAGEMSRSVFVIDITRSKYFTVKQRSRMAAAFAQHEALLQARVAAFVFVARPVAAILLKAIWLFSKKIVQEAVVLSMEDAVEYAMDQRKVQLVQQSEKYGQKMNL